MNYKKMCENAVAAYERQKKEEMEKPHKFLVACKNGDLQFVRQYVENEMGGRVRTVKPSPWEENEVNPLISAIKGEQEEIIQYLLSCNYLLGLRQPLMAAVRTSNFSIVKRIADAGTLENFGREDMHKAIELASANGNKAIANYLKEKLGIPILSAEYPFMPFPYTCLTDTLLRYKGYFRRSWNYSDTDWNNIVNKIATSNGVKALLGCAAVDHKPPYYKDLVYTASNLYHLKYWGQKYTALFVLLILDYWRQTLGQDFSEPEIDAVAHQALAEMASMS